MAHYRATVNNPVVTAVEVELTNATLCSADGRAQLCASCLAWRMGQTGACVIHHDDGTVGPTMSETGSDLPPRLGRHVGSMTNG